MDANVDDMSSFAESDANDEKAVTASNQQKWRDVYLSVNPNRNVGDYFMSRFYKYLIHAEGGAHSEQQGLLHVRQVHNILTVLDPQGTDLPCLARRSGLGIWDKFCVPKLKSKQLTGNTLKVYLCSMQFFVRFIYKGLLYKKDMLNPRHKEIILRLTDRLPDYRATIHRRTAHPVTTRKVDEAFARLTPSDIRKVETSELAKSAIKLIGLAVENNALTQNQFFTVRDYLLVTTSTAQGQDPWKMLSLVASSRPLTVLQMTATPS